MKLTFLKFVLYFFLKNVKGQGSATIDYCSINRNHLLCNISEPTDVDPAVRLHYPKNDKERNIVLDEFNKMRNAIARGDYEREGTIIPEGSNLIQLEWCRACEGAAWKNIKDCVPPRRDNIFPRCCNCLNTGELILIPIHIEEPNSNLSPEFDINDFLNKSIYFSREKEGRVNIGCVDRVTIKCIQDHPLLIPMVHSKLTQIGCAYVRCPELMENNHFLCFIGTLFRILNNKLYDKGKSCSACPPESKCSSKYTSLCECKPIQKCQASFPDPRGICFPGERVSRNTTTEDPFAILTTSVTDTGTTKGVEIVEVPFLYIPSVKIMEDNVTATAITTITTTTTSITALTTTTGATTTAETDTSTEEATMISSTAALPSKYLSKVGAVILFLFRFKYFNS